MSLQQANQFASLKPKLTNRPQPKTSWSLHPIRSPKNEQPMKINNMKFYSPENVERERKKTFNNYLKLKKFTNNFL